MTWANLCRGAVRGGGIALLLGATGCARLAPDMKNGFQDFAISYDTKVNAELQAQVEGIDVRLRTQFGMTSAQTAVGVLDLRTLRLAMIHPDREEYAASVPKIGILLAYFQLHPESATNLDATTRHELGLMIKVSNNEMAAKYSRALGLREIQTVLNAQGFYDAARGGGLWVGKHYGQGGERIGSPVGENSHAATVRQLLRFYLLLEQGKLVSPQASRGMREIFESPDIAPVEDKFVKGLSGRGVAIIRKSGWWENWWHDTAVVTSARRHYIVVAMTHHARGEEYLVEFARAVDDLMAR